MACIFRPSFVLFVLLFRLVNSVLFVLLLCTFRFFGLTWSLDSNLITTKPGLYSVSRLNILMGIVLLITWIIILTAHYIGAIRSFNCINCNSNCIIHTIVLVILVILFFFILITAALNVWAKSQTLTSPAKSNT